MRKILAAAIGLASMIAAPVMAADLAVKAAPPIRVFNWTGCYVGGNGGGLWAQKEWFNTEPAFGAILFGGSYGTHEPKSWIGGAQAGCDYQSAGGFVAGIAGDYDWTDAKASNPNLLILGFSDQSRIKSLASVTGRIGYAWDRFLGHVKGGGAWERDDYTLFDPTGATHATASEIRGGWTVGIGGEYAFTDWISGFAEYDYYNFGTRSNTLTCVAAGCFGGIRNTVSFDVKETKSVFKVGLNFRWSPVPVVAKY